MLKTNCDYAAIKCHLNLIDWSFIYREKDINSAFSIFHRVIADIIDIHVQIKVVQTRAAKKLPTYIRRLHKKKLDKYKSITTASDREEYKLFSKYCCKTVENYYIHKNNKIVENPDRFYSQSPTEQT